MRVLGNILWLILGGLESAICCFLAGLICCITIIFIPIGLQCFKLAGFFIWPMGKSLVKTNGNGGKTFINILWAILAGWEHFLIYGFVGCLFCITVIGIPFGLQYFKVAKFYMMPLGHEFIYAK